MAQGQSQCRPCSRPFPRLVSSPQGMELAAGARAWIQVKARRARALSRGWMVSSPQGWMVERARTYATMLAHGVHDGAALCSSGCYGLWRPDHA
ncbi:hypothetical protein CHLRE_17g743346v5 [Chlamydomonas reinhardtii]|uniref:Uncharacterized protein n=1 Tax=Chlamydomonas reinhardtii TaxID=3055 RepID=A0A2K3CRW2_CHLRE|nr:uncharacterized protein CHLRE_17g743346v5 [Chlamydomonas reinhardtii]PNW71026.1 hypothetical protein CHLRE_17g743346v5 [Chlamydomonas reinhardtii]